jgi:nitrous oxidase accessory protein
MKTDRVVALCASILILAATLLMIQGHAISASSGPRYVDQAGTCEGNSPCYTTIQAAVDAALAGDAITVYPGTYVENVSVDKDALTVQSKSGAASTIVHAANSADSAFAIAAEHVLIHGFTVRNNTTLCDITFGGITVGGDHATLSANTSTGNCKGIVLHASHITVTENIISDNRAYVGSDGIYVWPNFTDITITDNNILNNADEGFQQEIGGEDIVIERNVISNNDGTGVYLGTGGQNIVIERNAISHSGGPGVYQPHGGQNIVIVSNDILENEDMR